MNQSLVSMYSKMIPAIDQLQVFDSIVESVAIFVMNMLCL